MFYTHVKVWGNQILYRYIDDRGERKQEKVPFAPTLFVPSNKASDWKTIEGRAVSEMKFPSINDAKDFVKQYEHVEKFDIFGNTGWQYQFLGDKFKGRIKYEQSKIRVSYIDIEVNSSNGFPEPDVAQEPVTAITITYGDQIHTYGCKAYTPKMENHFYHQAKNEYDLLAQFIRRWALEAPDAITGWNIETFDMPYLVNRIGKILGPEQVKQFSPWGIIQKRKKRIKMQSNYIEKNVYEIGGVSTLDYLDAYKKFTYDPREQWTLHFIAQEELEDTKIEYDGELGLHGLYDEDYEKFIDYNVKDVVLVQKLEEKKKILSLIFLLAYMSKTNYEDTFSQVRMWDALIYNRLLAKKIVIPFKDISSKEEKYPGAYVMEPQIGKHRYVASFDLTSLYPSLFMQYNVGVETLVPWHVLPKEIQNYFATKKITVDGLLNREYDLSILKEHGLALAANGEFFKTDKTSFMAEIVSEMFDERKTAKKKMLEYEQLLENESDPKKREEYEALVASYDVMQLGIKVTMNSMYGAAGNEYFRFFDVRLATAITLSGQLALRWVRKAINEWMNRVCATKDKDYIIYGDTDSIYVNMDGLMDKIAQGREFKTRESAIDLMDKLAKDQVQPVINGAYEDLFQYLNCRKQMMIMKREALADGAIFTGKKRYVLSVWDSEGVRYKTPKMKVKGMEIVRSSTPYFVRSKLKDAVKLMLTEDVVALRKFVSDYKQDYMNAPISAIAFPRSVNNIKQYETTPGHYEKGTPAQVKAAISYNRMLREKKCDKKYKAIGSGEKIKWVYLKEPNPIQEDAIAFRSTFPPEFGLDKFVDYNVQFEKSFIKPIENILEAIGWELEEKSTLEAFFS